MKKIICFLSLSFIFLNADAQNEPYHGGISDGHASSAIIAPLEEPIAYQAYKGGNADGHSSDSITNLVFAYPPQFYAFFGGDNDGWAGTLVTAVVLPVNMLELSGYSNSNENNLIWKTASEQNSDYFSIEKSRNGFQYDSIGKVNAAGYSNNIIQYRYTDSSPFQGNNFYRLKMMDKDGSYEYSSVILLKSNTGKINISAYPNPVKDILKVELPGSYPSAIPCRIIDAIGKTVFAGSIPAGNALYMFNVSKLAKGSYYLQLQLPEGLRVVQLSK